jgi:hypothetical protein
MVCGLGKIRKPQRHKEHKGLEVNKNLCGKWVREKILNEMETG